jgi:uncharacterized protein
MPIQFNIRHLESDSLSLRGELPSAELDLGGVDELIQVAPLLKHDLVAERYERSILVQGSLELTLECECVRCLRPFKYQVELSEWSCLLPLEGEDKVLINNDCVDLTPYIREDILLAFPQHPLCEPECSGLPAGSHLNVKKSHRASQSEDTSSAWAELNKLKL